MTSLYRSRDAQARVADWCRGRLATWPVRHRTEVLFPALGRTHVVLVEGPRPEGTVCLYVPGAGLSVAASLPLLADLADYGPVVTADLPGQPGLSGPDVPIDELVGYSQWVAELAWWVRSRYPGRRVVLAGHARGASVALTAPPGVLDALALFSPAGLVAARPATGLIRARKTGLLRREGRAGSRALGLMSGPGVVASPELAEWAELVRATGEPSGTPGPMPRSTLERWRGTPVSVAVGEHDALFGPDRLAPVVRSALGVDVRVIPGAGHLLVSEEPALAAALMHAV